MISVGDLPHLNAALNSTSGVLLVGGYVFIRRGNPGLHRACMVAACITSTAFLVSYLVYHYQVGSRPFTGEGWVRPVYFAILISHIVLAAAIVPLVALTLVRAWKERFEAHRRVARWTLPLWLYVSVTGVIVYLMLYQM